MLIKQLTVMAAQRNVNVLALEALCLVGSSAL
jgi:hypothetical protein